MKRDSSASAPSDACSFCGILQRMIDLRHGFPSVEEHVFRVRLPVSGIDEDSFELRGDRRDQG
jgi:hypothetical protein